MNDSPIILNHLNKIFLKEMICFSKAKEKLLKLKKKNKDYKRGTIGWSLVPSPSNGLAWTQPEPKLNRFCDRGKLNKPGYSINFPDDLKCGMGLALNYITFNLEKIVKDKMKLPFLQYNRRHCEFSSTLQNILHAPMPVYYEGCTLKISKEDVQVHVDGLNCWEKGYNLSSVLSIVDNFDRYSWIGYNRKPCNDYMKRRREAYHRYITYTRRNVN